MSIYLTCKGYGMEKNTHHPPSTLSSHWLPWWNTLLKALIEGLGLQLRYYFQEKKKVFELKNGNFPLAMSPLPWPLPFLETIRGMRDGWGEMKIWAEYWGEYSRPMEEKTSDLPTKNKQANLLWITKSWPMLTVCFLLSMLDHRG